MVPTVYKTPPRTNQKSPQNSKLATKGLSATTTSQPIAIYKSVERILNFLTKNILNTIPIAANIQTVEKSIHPVLPCNVISVKGVYVPAIKIYIAE